LNWFDGECGQTVDKQWYRRQGQFNKLLYNLVVVMYIKFCFFVHVIYDSVVPLG